jgi:hypothetical protein
MRAALLLSLSLLSACVESAAAQPRPDAGRRFIIRPPVNQIPRRADPREVNRALLGLLAAPDGGMVSVVGSARSGMDGAGIHGMNGLGGFALTGTMPDGGASLGSMGVGGLGTRGSRPGSGSGMGFGRWNVGTRRDARYDEVTVQGDLPRWAVVSELSRAAVRTHNCLIALGPHGPIDAPVRLIVRPPTTLDAITVDGASEGVTRCARESLQRMILGPVTAPVEVSAWLRAPALTP